MIVNFSSIKLIKIYTQIDSNIHINNKKKFLRYSWNIWSTS
jgi:hypothetical protein